MVAREIQAYGPRTHVIATERLHTAAAERRTVEYRKIAFVTSPLLGRESVAGASSGWAAGDDDVGNTATVVGGKLIMSGGNIAGGVAAKE